MVQIDNFEKIFFLGVLQCRSKLFCPSRKEPQDPTATTTSPSTTSAALQVATFIPGFTPVSPAGGFSLSTGGFISAATAVPTPCSSRASHVPHPLSLPAVSALASHRCLSTLPRHLAPTVASVRVGAAATGSTAAARTARHSSQPFERCGKCNSKMGSLLYMQYTCKGPHDHRPSPDPG